MEVMHMPGYSALNLSCEWTVKERVSGSGVWVVRKRVRNIITNYGLTALASALSGVYAQPQYLAIEGFFANPSSSITAGAGSISLTARVDLTGDTQIVLGVGLGVQETVTFTGVSGSGPYTYTLSGTCANNHATSETCFRLPLVTDTVAQLQGELQYDSTNFPSTRMQSPGGYSGGAGNWTIQFYFPGGTAATYITAAGLTDNSTLGGGNLHNHFVLGYNHTSLSTDLEIDGSLTLVNGP